jgi:glycosyltransferase involved in cell wall biosynthesis
MKILYIIDSLRLGGKERRLVELLKDLETKKYIRCQLVVLSDDAFYNYVDMLDIKIHHLIRKCDKDPYIFIKLYKICKDFQPDIIHSWEAMCSIYVLPVAKLLGIKLINGMITSAPTKLKLFGKSWIRSKLTFPFSDLIISNSYAGLKSYNAPKHKSYCIHNGFDFSRTRNLEDQDIIRKSFKIDSAHVVGMVASFSPRKDYETYILSAIQILQKRNDLTFLAVGDGSTLEKYKGMVKPKFKKKIKLIGKQNNIESIVNIFDIGVLLTDQDIHGEGIANSILEYMALGKPVIATSGGGTSEIVIHDKTGYLIEPKNTEALSKKIEFLLNNKGKAKLLGKAGKERVIREFSIKKMRNRFIKKYIELSSLRPRLEL